MQRDIDVLHESNRLDWLKLAMSSISSDRRLEIRKNIAARDVQLWGLIQKKWNLIANRDGYGDVQRATLTSAVNRSRKVPVEIFVLQLPMSRMYT